MKIITKFNYENEFDNNNYGIIEIESTSNCIYKWDLRVIKRKDNLGVAIGIGSKQCPNIYQNNSGGSYYYFCDRYIRSSDMDGACAFGQEWEEGNILTFNLDLKHAQISLARNGKDQRIAFRNITKSKDVKYRLFLWLYSIDHSVEILHFY